MAAIQPFYYLLEMFGINIEGLSIEERQILEIEIFLRVCIQLKEDFKKRYKEYFYIMRFNVKKERIMLDKSFLRLIIQDILSTGAYDLSGIAIYTYTPQDIVMDVATGCNTNPSAVFQRRLLELHKEIRGDLYTTIVKKIILENLNG